MLTMCVCVYIYIYIYVYIYMYAYQLNQILKSAATNFLKKFIFLVAVFNQFNEQ